MTCYWPVFLIFSVVSCFCAVFSMIHCSFLRVEYSDDEYRLGLYTYNQDDLKISYDSGSTCRGYYNEGFNFDSFMKAARAFGALAAISTGFAMIGVAYIRFVRKGEPLFGNRYFGLAILYIASLIFQGLTFLMFAIDTCSDEIFDVECTPGAAGIVAIENMPLITALIIFSFFAHPLMPSTPAEKESAPVDEESAPEQAPAPRE